MRPSAGVQQMCNCSGRATNAAQQVDSSFGGLSDDQVYFHSVVSCRKCSRPLPEEQAQYVLFPSKPYLMCVTVLYFYWCERMYYGRVLI